MPNTTNFNFPTPADTDLVKDGASAIRSLGDSIDTTFVDLKGGTTGQVLTKASNTNMDFSWGAVSSGLTFISSTTFTNSTGADIDNIFSSSYENYLVVLDDLTSVSGGAYIGMQLRYSTTTQTTSYYTVSFEYNAQNTITTNGKDNGNSYVIARVHSSSPKSSAQFFISHVGNTSEVPTIRGQFSNGEGTAAGVFGGRTAAQTYTGIRLISDSIGGGANISGRVTVYGLAKA